MTFTLPGLRFFFDGQFTGAALRAPVQLGRWPAEPDRPEIRDLYARLLPTIDRPLFHDGDWALLDVRPAGNATSAAVIACAWRHAGELAVVTANITNHPAQGLVDVGTLPDGESFHLTDQLSGERYHWTRADLYNGLYVRLNAGDAHLFTFNAV